MLASLFVITVFAFLQTGYSPGEHCIGPYESVFQSDAESISSIPSTGLMVTINPDMLIGEGLTRSWRRIDEPYGKLHVKSSPLSKVNFNLSPKPSEDGAVIEIKINGTSVGPNDQFNGKN